jgi:hypothetical protein
VPAEAIISIKLNFTFAIFEKKNYQLVVREVT